MDPRPLSPHVFIYRFAYTMATSIFHRVTGVALSAGLIVLVAWLAALATGPEAYARFAAFAATWPMKVLLALWIIAFCYHLANGVRHLLWDAGLGMERPQARLGAWVVVCVTVLLSAALLYGLLFARAAS